MHLNQRMPGTQNEFEQLRRHAAENLVGKTGSSADLLKAI
jgi:hypothetical protein